MVNFRRSLFITFLATSSATVAQFLTSLVLARLLSPSEIGVFSITAVMVGIAGIFRDFGVSTFLQREAELTPQKIRAAIGVMFTLSWLIGGILYAASSFAATWFKEPAIKPVMQVLSLGFLFIPFGTITHALLTRQFAAGKESFVTFAGTSSYCISCLTLAWAGFGVMSLAWANLINIIVCGLAYIPLRPKGVPWLPSLRGWGQILNFGAGSLISNCAGAINNALPDLLLGKLGSAYLVGLFSRANSTVTIFSYIAGATVNYGAVAYISQAHHRGESLGKLLGRNITLLTGIGWPILAVIGVMGADIVAALYGPKWTGAVPAIPALVLAAAISMMFNYTPAALAAVGRPYLSAIPTAATIVVRVAIGIYFFNGTLLAFSWAICFATALAMPILIYQNRLYLDLSFGSLCRAVHPSALVAMLCAITCVVLKWVLDVNILPIYKLLLSSLPLILVWYAGLRLTSHPLVDEVDNALRLLYKRVF